MFSTGMRQAYLRKNVSCAVISRLHHNWLSVFLMLAAIQRIRTLHVFVCSIPPVGVGIFWLALPLVSLPLRAVQAFPIRHRWQLYSAISGVSILIPLLASLLRCN